MKKSLALIISLAFFGSSISMPAFAAVKAGSSCKKAGVTTVASGKKFTCVKSGKKFVWNKGVTIQVPSAPAPSSEPSPSASAEPASAYPKSPTSFDDLVENYKGISYGAWSKSQAKIKSSEKTDFTYKLVLGPNSTLTNKEPTVAFHLVTRLYSGYAKPGDVYFLAFNFEDRDWAAKQMNSIMPNAVSQWIYDVACPSKEMCDGGGAYFDGSNKYLVVETVGLINENTTSGTLEAHEFTHTIQQKTMGSPRPPVEFLTSPWLPNWYWEGQARFAQDAAIWSNSFETYLRVRNATSGGLIQSTQYNSKYIEEYFVLNPNKEWGAKHARQRQYDLGARLIEVLTAIKGPDSTMEMWKLAGSGSSLEAAFEKVYGTPFKTALPIISKAIALDLGRS